MHSSLKFGELYNISEQQRLRRACTSAQSTRAFASRITQSMEVEEDPLVNCVCMLNLKSDYAYAGIRTKISCAGPNQLYVSMVNTVPFKLWSLCFKLFTTAKI